MSDAYARAGVDLEAGAKAVQLIGDLARGARRPEMRDDVGGFAGLIDLGDGRLLAAGTDGVGTKLEIARQAGRLDTVGIDLVAMCADDVVCTGAEPLLFLDYLAIGTVVPERVAEIVAGVAEGCRRAGCALLGGETAEHPGTMPDDAFDLAGFCVGLVGADDLLGSDRVKEGDVLVGLASSGLHANGYSLVRTAMLGSGTFLLDETPEGLDRPLVDELLEPTAIYAPHVLELTRQRIVHAAAHITGGGIPENLPRVLPEGLGAELDESAWPALPIFDLVRRAAGATDEDMRATFNMGIGMILVVSGSDAIRVLDAARGKAMPAYEIGRVVTGEGVRYVTARST
ncbi:MAG: phosphoribosylformylglycinamidine cyclo-ligase [Actinomycetota bacterium]